MFEAKEEITRMVGRLIKVAEPLKRGDVIGHEAIVEILGCQPHTEHWQLCIGKLKRHMERVRGISIWSEPTVGYKLCTIQEQIEIGHTRKVWARRHLKKGIRSVEAVPTKGLTLHQQKLRAMHSESLKRNHRELTSAIHSKLPTERRTETLPRYSKPANTVA